MRTLLALTILIAAASSLLAQGLSADIVITNANIHTMNTRQPTAGSIAVLNGRIVAVGSDADTRAMIGSKTQVIDAGGRLVLPGFNDAHVHFLPTGETQSGIDLRNGVTSSAEFVRRLKEFAAKQPK